MKIVHLKPYSDSEFIGCAETTRGKRYFFSVNTNWIYCFFAFHGPLSPIPHAAPPLRAETYAPGNAVAATAPAVWRALASPCAWPA